MPRTPGDNPRERASDRGRFRAMLHHLTADRGWVFVISVVLLIALIKTSHNTSDIQEGRRATSGIICDTVNGISEAGRQALTGELQPPPTAEQDKQLQALGFPPQSVRDANGKKAAEAYIDVIINRVQARLVKNGTDPKVAAQIKRKDGTLNCDKISELAKVK